MTLAIVWIEERAGGGSALCFASDSRTTPGPIEGVNKVLLFGRSDVAGVWAGDYRYAAIVASHLDAVFTATRAMRDRDVDVARALRQASSSIASHLHIGVQPAIPAFQLNASAQEPERTTVIVGGYSIEESTYVALSLTWEAAAARWNPSVRALVPARLLVIGDGVKKAKQDAKAARRHRHPLSGASWHMEPLGALHLACWDRNRPTIGGDLQLAKVFKHGSARAYGIRDPLRGGQSVSVRGTRLTAPAAREFHAGGLLVDLGIWSLPDGWFGLPGRYGREGT